jgi:hypothetical protein
MKNIGLLFGILLLGACATGPDRGEQMRAEQARVRGYCSGLYHDPALDPIRTKVAVDQERDTTVQMIADKSKATDSEKAALLIWANKRQDCFREGTSAMRRFSPPIPPQAIAIDEAMFPRLQFLMADLYSQVLTYGEFARKRKELATEVAAKKQELRDLLAQRSEEARYRADQLANDARRAAAAEEANRLREQANRDAVYQRSLPPSPTTCTTRRGLAGTIETTCQ